LQNRALQETEKDEGNNHDSDSGWDKALIVFDQGDHSVNSTLLFFKDCGVRIILEWHMITDDYSSATAAHWLAFKIAFSPWAPFHGYLSSMPTSELLSSDHVLFNTPSLLPCLARMLNHKSAGSAAPWYMLRVSLKTHFFQSICSGSTSCFTIPQISAILFEYVF
jgi:hypothetical protein